MGWNKYSQLGALKDENNYLPKFLYKFTDNISVLKCAPWATIVF